MLFNRNKQRSMFKISITISFLFIGSLAFCQQTLNRSDNSSAYTQAHELLDKRNYTAAREGFEQYMRHGQDGMKVAEAEYYAAFCALALYNKDGEAKINQFIQNNPKHPKAAMANYELGSFYFDQKKYGKALLYLKKVRLNTLDSKSRDEARYKMGYSYFANRQLEEALPHFNALKNKKGRYSINALYYAGFIELDQNDLPSALMDLKKAEKNEAYAHIVPYMIVSIYYKQQNYDQLLAYGKSVINHPKVLNKHDINLLMASAYFDQGNFEEAEKGFDRLGSKSKLPAEATYRAGVTKYKMGAPDAAVGRLKGIANGKDSLGVVSSYYLGLSYLKMGNKLYALNAFKQSSNPAISKEIAEESAYQHAKLVFDQGNTTQAIDNFSKFVHTYPNSSYYEEINGLLSQAYLNSSDFEAAIQHIEELPRMTWSMKKVYQKATFMKGAELFNKNKYAEAFGFFQKSLTYPIDQEYLNKANFWAGECMSITRQYDVAERHYRSVVTNKQENDDLVQAKARYALGYLYYNKKQYADALMHFRLFKKNATDKISRSTYNDGSIRLADCLYATKAYNDAIAAYDALLKTKIREKDYILYQKGIVLAMVDRMAASINSFDAVVKRYSSSKYYDDALFHKARVQLENGDFEASIASLNKLIQEKKGSKFIPYAYSKRATAYANLGNQNAAAKDYKYILNTYTNHSAASEAIISLQEVLAQTGNSDAFDQYLALYKKANPENLENLEEVDFQAARNAYFNQEYTNAANKLSKFKDNYPQSRHFNEASFFLGEANYRNKNYQKALEQYYPLLNIPAFDYRVRVINRIASLEFALGRYSEAVKYFRKLNAEAVNKKHEQDAEMGLMESYFILANYDSSDYYANQLLASGSANIASQNKASLYLGKSAFAKGDFETAKDEFLTTLNTAKDVYGAEAQYSIGLIFYRSKEHQKSIDALIELNNEFYSYENWLGKAFLLIADNYSAMGEVFQAKATLKSLIDGEFPDEEILNEAKLKLTEIEEQELLQIEIDSLEIATDSLNIEENEN